ncbi:MAG TPA: SPOR domain-containing protein [Pyrinomonadaceae bacterium]|nr:SPOR domain-containing protein [Pyrinomonadaceae bacterium]
MRVTCPKCQLKSLIDTAPLDLAARVVCARCATVFETVLATGGVQKDAPSHATSSLSQTALLAPGTAVKNLQEADDLLIIPPAPPIPYLTSELAPVLEDVSLASPSEMGLLDQVITPQIDQAPEPAASPEQNGHHSPHESLSLDRPLVPEGKPFQFSRATQDTLPSSDQPGQEVRLMRVSPVWFLISGLVCLSLIIFFNWVAKPTDQANEILLKHTAPKERVTNPAAKETSPPVQPQAIASQPPVVAPSARPVVETKAPPAPALKQPTPEVATHQSVQQKAGGFTIQVGSYDTLAQAAERVARLRSAGYEARVVRAEIPKRGTWYRVQTGRFSNRDEAARYGTQLRAKGAAESLMITEYQAQQ